MIVSGETQVYGILGDPVEHSVSPAMHNAAFSHLGLNCVYVPFLVKEGELPEAIQGIKALNIRGVNITLPHKAAVLNLLDDVETVARDIGAVNTVANHHGELVGYNTDASGFRRALTGAGVEPRGKKVTLLGAGGAARAIAAVLADRGADITIINRNLDKAQRLASQISTLFRKNIEACELTGENLEWALKSAEVIVNATSIGMYPGGGSPIPAELLRPDLIVLDIIYNPLKTPLLTDAEKRGAKIITGLDMLVWQGARAFEIWTGKSAPVDEMRKAAVRTLKQHEN